MSNHTLLILILIALVIGLPALRYAVLRIGAVIGIAVVAALGTLLLFAAYATLFIGSLATVLWGWIALVRYVESLNLQGGIGIAATVATMFLPVVLFVGGLYGAEWYLRRQAPKPKPTENEVAYNKFLRGE